MRSLIFAAALLASTAAFAADAPVVENGWARATASGQAVGGGFLTLRNPGDTADRVTGASTSADVADKVELHTHINENGVMKMRPVPSIDVPAKGSVTFAPGGLHLMLFGLKKPLTEGQHVPVTLTLEKAGPVKGELVVTAAGAKAAPAAMGEHNHAH